MEDNEVIKINYDAENDAENNKPLEELAVEKSNDNDNQEYAEDSRKESRWGKIKEIKEQRNYLAEENELLKQELAERDQLFQNQYRSNVYNIAQNVNNEYLKAKEYLERALYENNPALIADATAELTAKSADLENARMNLVNYEEGYRPVEPYNYKENQVFNPVEEWLEENEELDDNSPNFNPDLVNQLIPYIRKVDNKLKQNKQNDLIGTPQYFNLLDKYIDQLKGIRSNDNGHVGPVNSRHGGGSSSRGDRIQLTNDQKEAAIAFDMTEKEYAGYLKKYAEEARNGR